MRIPLIRGLGMWTLLIPGVVALQPAFGGWEGYLPGLAGITAGILLGLVAARFAWSPLVTVLAIAAVYYLLGGAVALSRTTIAGVVPTLETLGRLTLLLVQGWRDLLTVATPAGDFTGPAVVPWLTGLVCGVVAACIVARTKAVFWPLVVPVTLLAFSIAFGVRTAPTAAWLGVALAVGMVAWVWIHETVTQHRDNADILINRSSDGAKQLQRAVVGVVILGLAAGAAVGATVATGHRVNRQVLRDDIAPPLDLRNYPSPLMKYRFYETEQKDDTLFTVTGMPENSRLRLAVMNTYDGNVFNVSQQTSQYRRTGRSVAQDLETNTQLKVEVGEYKDVWVPLAGAPRWLEFGGGRATVLSDGTYYNSAASQTIGTAGLQEGDSFHLDAMVTPELTDEQRAGLGAKTPGTEPLAKMDRVPELLTTLASEYSEGKGTPFEQLVAIEARLRQGYYSDGTKDKSRSGHTTERLSTMFRNPALIGDDEQYATAMAIMANQLGVPARVVLGFYPEEHPGEVWKVKGTEGHVWVEANFAGHGWVAFNPTPERNREPKTEVPKPKPKPKPQVDPPPNPPEKVPDEPVLADQDPADRDDNEDGFDWGIVLLILGVLGGAGLVASPFLLILAWKARRATKRRTAVEAADRVAGAWDEIVDRARDMGYSAALSRTRREAATHLQDAYPDVGIAAIATHVDAGVFGPTHPPEEMVEAVWQEAGSVKAALMAQLPWFKRPLAALSLRSLRKARVAPRTKNRKAPERGEAEPTEGHG